MGALVVLRTKVASIAKPARQVFNEVVPSFALGTAFLVRLQCSALKGGSGFAMGAPVVLRTKVAPIRKTCAAGFNEVVSDCLGERLF